jgi:predicted helicase
MSFQKILDKYRKFAASHAEKGARFERLMQAYLRTDPQYAHLKQVWLWDAFPFKTDLGTSDMGIDLVAVTDTGDFWAIQCKCYAPTSTMDKATVDSFLATSSRTFRDETGKTIAFAQRLWISTSNKWGPNAFEALKNQNPPVARINVGNLQQAPVDWMLLENGIHGQAARLPQKRLFPHQNMALNKTHTYFKTHSRGKLIMACGTGKTFTSLRIAEKETPLKGLVLFLVPSIALLGQTLREWFAEAQRPIRAICICSDPEISKKKTKNEDMDQFSTIDLALPASTDVPTIVKQWMQAQSHEGLTVVFSTYQSIEVVSKAQKALQDIAPEAAVFDLIICDEAHRTTGVTLAEGDESAFVKVHNNDFLKAKRRLYMTATPRLYSEDSKSKAAQNDAVLCSMDDAALYGDEIYRIGFGEAVEKGLLTDYKVLILTLSDKEVPPAVQRMIADPNAEINTDDASKLIGCLNALSKQILGDSGSLRETDPEPMRRAVAFCQNIVVSKKITATFNSASSVYIDALPDVQKAKMVSLDAKHIDGSMSAPQRDDLLTWLKAEMPPSACRVLTNVRCLSEGVDVPSLDAVLFLSPRNSQVDVVQSVGRVMRKSKDKKYGYIIIPVLVPSDVEAARALDDNERFKVVWTVLNALRAHDDRFNATVNQLELNRHKPNNILIGRPAATFSDFESGERGRGVLREDAVDYGKPSDGNAQLALQFAELQQIVFARLVQKVGDRRYWEQWAKNVAEIAERHTGRITRLVRDGATHQQAFQQFLNGLRKNIHPSIAESDAVEMLAQHLITKPVFEALFEGYSFVQQNPISVSMQKMLDILEKQALDKDTESLIPFYESVKMRAAGIDNAEGKQRIIIELYDKFFKTAFPRLVEQLGIVYTPVEVVDFILHSVNDVLKKAFGRRLSDENVHILDPFTGTGTFITRLLQSGLIDKPDLIRKFNAELHANEMVLLAYYIAAVNIENAFHDAAQLIDYQSFNGICLTDTFQLGEADGSEALISEVFPQNSAQVARQKNTPLKIIIGNPPYSVGQKSANDNAQNQNYERLDARIAKTYAAETDATNKNSLYDSYIKAFRWSTDRLDGDGGIIAFVSNGAWLEGNSADGLRKCLEKEFSEIYVLNLRGNQRTSGELSRKEGGKIFGSGSRTPIAITLLVKKPKATAEKATIYYHDIGDYLSREQKLTLITQFHSVANVPMQILSSNEHGDWISHRSDLFETFIALGDKDAPQLASFFKPIYGRGLATSRDAWCYNASKNELCQNIKKTIWFFNQQSNQFKIVKKTNPTLEVDSFIDLDSTQISWDRQQKKDVETFKQYNFDNLSVRKAIYRPFFKQWVYFNRQLNNCVYQLPKSFPNEDVKNLVICVSGVGVTKDFSAIMTDTLPDLELMGKSQCFPLYYYEEKVKTKTLFDEGTDRIEYERKDGISDYILGAARRQYGQQVTKEAIFYYVYGLLHSTTYRLQFGNDLKKRLPRLPLLEKRSDFEAFSAAGRALSNLHIGYENVPAYAGVQVTGAETGNYQVEKMRFVKKEQKDVIVYNSQITLSEIPAAAYEYVVNGKSAIEWVMERYQKTTHKESGISNDPNEWAKAVGKPRYILDLLLSVINVSVQTVKIVSKLPFVIP